MKRMTAWILLLVMILCLSACAKNKENESTASNSIKEESTTDSREESSGENQEISQETSREDPSEEQSEAESSEESTPTEDLPEGGSASNVVTAVQKSDYAKSYEDLYERLEKMGYYDYWGWDEVVEEEMPAEEEVWEEAEEDAAIDWEEKSEEASADDRSNDYSHTNTQEEDVDEADIVKTDGKFIYTLKEGEQLVIFKADGADVSEVSRTLVAGQEEKKDSEGNSIYIDNYVQDLYIYEDRLVVLAACYNYVTVYDPNSIAAYGYSRDTSRTRAFIYDIADRSKPKLMKVVEQDGYYNTSRLIEDKLYLLSVFHVYEIPERKDIGIYVPHYYVDEESSAIPAEDILCPPEASGRSYTVIGAYALGDASVVQTQAVLGNTSYVYMNTQGLYLADCQYEDTVTDTWKESVYKVENHVYGDVTTITHYVLKDGKLSYTADGKVSGRIYGQFALNETDGYLRVVTTGYTYSYREYYDEKYGFRNTIDDSGWEDTRQVNDLFVLDADMNTVGSLLGLAPNERVYSVRYDGNIAYFCTFRQVDPLFTVDVSDPTAPKELSALKIPGFSDYLHVYGEGRLFGLGRDADESTGWVQGMKLTMFDTSDPTDVKVLFDTYPNAYSSEANYNHKAVLVDPGKDLIGFPTDNGYMVYGYNDTEGFYLKKEIPLKYSWQSRGLYIGDYFYIVDQSHIVVIDLTSLEQAAYVVY